VTAAPAVKLGLLSTSPINSALLETRSQSYALEVVAVGSRAEA
jgi:hypothetical protein